MKRCVRGNVEWLQFDLFSSIAGLSHGVFLRAGGESASPFSSLNLSEYVGDDPAAVMENWRRVAQVMQLEHIARCRQTHGTYIARTRGKLLWESCDGLITIARGVGIAVRHADCQAAFMYDPVTEAIGIVHAGWRGQALDVYARAIDALRVQYGVRPENLLVGISPSIGPQYTRLDYREGKILLPKSFFSFEEKPLHFNLWDLARAQLEACHVQKNHIEVASICTYSHPKDFFSFRRDKPLTGRNVSVIGKL